MQRIAVGVAAAVAIWFGSAVVAEAQSPTITTTGPLAITPGPSATYTGSVYLPTPCGYRIRISVMRGSTQIHYSESIIANPGTSNSTVNRTLMWGYPISAGDVLDFYVSIKVGTTWYNASNSWQQVVQATRPTSTKSTVYKSTSLALQSIERDRRRE